MRRLVPVLAAMAGVGFLVPLVGDSGPRDVTLLVPLASVLGLATVALTRRAASPDPGWTGPSPAILAAAGLRPARPYPVTADGSENPC